MQLQGWGMIAQFGLPDEQSNAGLLACLLKERLRRYCGATSDQVPGTMTAALVTPLWMLALTLLL